MYTCDFQRDTFDYILELDRIRSSIPEELRPSWIKVTTITLICKELGEIPINEFKDMLVKELDGHKCTYIARTMASGRSSEYMDTVRLSYDVGFQNQVSFIFDDGFSRKSMKIFPNGSVQIAGASDLMDCVKLVNLLIKGIFNDKKTINLKIDTRKIKKEIAMVNSNFSLNYHIDLYETYDHFKMNPMFDVTFDPDRYSAIKIKFSPGEGLQEKPVTVSIFGTGKVIVTGARSLKAIAKSYEIIMANLNDNDDIRVEKTTKVDVFGMINGYKIDDFIAYIKKIKM